jgi:6-phosphogluconate dehydrogenase
MVMEAVRLGIRPCLFRVPGLLRRYRSARVPANLIQAQRDYFGAHTYERVDQPRGTFFHTEWIKE